MSTDANSGNAPALRGGADMNSGNAPALRGGAGVYTPAVDQRALALIARIQRNHADVEAVLALADHYEAHGDLPSLANLMEGWAKTLRDDRKAADAFARAARAVSAGLSDDGRAQALYEQALQRFPEHARALVELETMLRERGDDTGLERMLSRAAESLSKRLADPKLRASIHLRLGQLYERRLRLPAQAIANYRRALELDAAQTEAIAAARDIYIRAGKPEAAADMYELEIAAADLVERRTALLIALAEHRHDALGDLDGAVLALRRVLKLAPENLEALERLAELLRQRSRQGRGEEAEADRLRSAELFFQLARIVPRRHARHRLHACLRLQADHPRAIVMLKELEAYGSPTQAQPSDPDISQAELDRRATKRFAPNADAQRDTVPYDLLPAAQDDAQAQELEAWLTDDEVEMLEDDVGLERMVPITERPPAPLSDDTPTPHPRSR